MTVDTERVRRAVLEILDAIGEDIGRDGLTDTPRSSSVVSTRTRRATSR